jgi:hypothetical protein
MPRMANSSGLNFIALQKPDGERFIWLYDHESRDELFRSLARAAANPELSFNWADAGVMAHDAQQLERETA